MPDPYHTGLIRDEGEILTVPTVPLGALLVRHGIGTVDLLSIDTEGTELDVWGSFDVIRHRPSVVIIEWETVGLPDRRRDIIARLTTDGYRVAHETTGNLIFVPEGPR